MLSLSITLVELEVKLKSNYKVSLELIPLQITAGRPMGQHKANVCHTSLISVEMLLFRTASLQAVSSRYIFFYRKKISVHRPSSCNSYAVRWALFTFLQQNEIIQECQKFSQICWRKFSPLQKIWILDSGIFHNAEISFSSFCAIKWSTGWSHTTVNTAVHF